MRTVLRSLPLFSLLGLLAASLAASAAENGTTRGQSRSHVATIPGAFDGTAKTVGFVPRHLKTSTRFAGHVTTQDVVEGGTYYEDPKTGRLIRSNGHPGEMMSQPMGEAMSQPIGEMMGQPMGEMMGDVGCADGACGSCGDCAYTAGCRPFSRGNLQLFAGVQSYTGPVNRPDGRGSFGFNEGLNWGTPLPGFGALGGQVGIRATQTNLSGTEFTNDSRNQGFLTAGLFRRVDQGLQGVVVVDYMSNSWYHDTHLTNVRGEFSWVHNGCQDLGFWFTTSTKSTVQTSVDGLFDEKWQPTDLFAIFCRQKFGACGDGEVRLSAGWSNRSDGYLAVDTLLPLTNNLSMEANFAYLIPEQGKGTGFDAGHAQESWNIGIGLVWYPGGCMSGSNSYYRPLLRVADNGVFMMDRISP